MEMDEGGLTAAVIAPYAAEDGKRGQAAAEAVLPLRRALWRAAETYAPARLAACLRVRARATDQTGRGGCASSGRRWRIGSTHRPRASGVGA